jgi:hypothetical protein
MHCFFKNFLVEFYRAKRMFVRHKSYMYLSLSLFCVVSVQLFEV